MKYFKSAVAYMLIGIREALTAMAAGLMFVAEAAKKEADRVRS